MTDVALDEYADTRLYELGLSSAMLQRALLRADAEAKLVTGLEPPTAEGTIRYFKTVRFLREELVPLGWQADDAKNFCRTIQPAGEWSLVTSSGDVNTGVFVPGTSPSTKYPKGDVTALAVAANAGQLALDLGDDYAEEVAEPPAATEKIWFLMVRITSDTIFVELSLPTKIDGGLIQEWQERIILTPIQRHDPDFDSYAEVEDPPSDGTGDYSVEVSRR